MQARFELRYWLAAVVLCSLLLAPTVFASSPITSIAFEQKMDIALKIWYGQHPEANVGIVHIASAAGTGSIEGTISQGDKPIEAADVFCWAVFSDKILSQSAITDADGVYKLVNLEAGDYFVIASAEGYQTAFYGGGMSPLDATPVAVTEGASTTGINFNLQKARDGAGSISGTVTGDGAIEGAWIVAFSKGNPFGNNHTFAISDVAGHYTISNLPKGFYILAAYAHSYIPEVYNDATSLQDVDLVPVNDDDVTNINFVLEKGGSISGHIKNDKDEPLAHVKVVAHSKDDFMPGVKIPGLANFFQMDYTDDQGNYKIEGLNTGNYYVSAYVCEQGFVDLKFYDDKTEMSKADPVAVTQGQETAGINFTFVMPTAKISGVITDKDGNPLKDIFIYYVSENDDVYHSWGRLWKNAKTDENGHYEIANLPAGTYYVSAWYWDWWNFKGVWYENADSLKDATPIPLADGEVRDDVNITLDMTGDYGSISGTVTFDEGGDPVAYAFVEAIPLQKKFNRPFNKHLPTMFAFTDAEGHYTIKPVYKGDYRVVVKVYGYKEYFDNKSEFADADAVTVLPGADSPNINFGIPGALTEGSKVSGIVTDASTGEPIAGAFVAVFPSRKHKWFDGNMPRWNKVYYTTFTDDQGAYTVLGIPEGSYVAAAWARDFVAEFYDNVRNPMKATVLELDGLAAAEGIDFALEPRTGRKFAQGPGLGRYGSIGGKIQSQGGLPVEGAFVYAVDGDNNVIACELSGEDGSYVLDGLEEGEYTIMVNRSLYETTFYPDAIDISDATSLSVTEEGEMDYANATVIMATSGATDAENEILSTTPTDFMLSQNYPNPFNPATVIEYRIPEAAHVSLQVFNVQGQLVKTLVNTLQSASSYKVTWDGTDMNGAVVPSGVYFYQLQANDFTQIRRLVFMQ